MEINEVTPNITKNESEISFEGESSARDENLEDDSTGSEKISFQYILKGKSAQDFTLKINTSCQFFLCVPAS